MTVQHVLLSVASDICSKQLAASLCGSYLAFFQNVFLKLKWCNHIVVLTARKNYHFTPSERSDFHMTVNLSITVYALPIRLLTSLSVDEILLPSYMN